MAKHIVLSDGEWKLMKLLWENHPMTLGDMVEAMQDDTAWSKGTIFTMLRRMSTKGVIRMDDSGKYQQYYPVLQKEEAEQAETRSFLERVYDGSVGMMLSAMAHECKLSNRDDLCNTQSFWNENQQQVSICTLGSCDDSSALPSDTME